MTPQDNIIGDPKYIPVLDHGFVGLVDHMGSDAAIVQAARVSYGTGTKTVNEDRGLIRYLIRKRHCYHPSMQVLTASGWKRWDHCKETETFLVPDPKTRTYRRETLEVLSFDADEELYTFKNTRMSYKVTSEHKMWFKAKHWDGFSKIAVNEMTKWGSFDPLVGYRVDSDENSAMFKFIGFFLGDGSYGSKNRIIFHLKKDRKKTYLVDLLEILNIPYSTKVSATYADALVYKVETPAWLRSYLVNIEARASEKAFRSELLNEMKISELLGLFDGLLNSDGSVSKGREQLGFSNTSSSLLDLFINLAPYAGYDAHRTYVGATAYMKKARLESRKHNHGREQYSGRVYCATTSTGLLAVRGDDTEFGFVCGNTSPIEMCDIKIHIKMPIFVARQFVRHRTASLNEYSGRYSVMSDEMYQPAPDMLKPQSKTNKQGRDGEFSDKEKEGVAWLIKAANEHAYESYEALLKAGADYPDDHARRQAIYDPYDPGEMGYFGEDYPGLSRELARIVLPVSNYTEMYWKQNLLNMLHLIHLRRDSHAQDEIRAYAEALFQIIQPLFPLTIEAWEDYVWHGKNLSRMDVDLVKELLVAGSGAGAAFSAMVAAAGSDKAFAESRGMSVRELVEFKDQWGF